MGIGPDCLVNVVERKTGYVLIGKLKARTQAAVTERIRGSVRSWPVRPAHRS
jgi:hypothetical protein